MVRVVCRIEVGRVTIVARRGQPLVHIVYVTLCAHRRLVSPRQWKVRSVVVEGGRLPYGCCMTGPTIVIEVPGNVVRVRRLRKLYLMTLVAISEHQLVIAVRVAALALPRNVRSCQREVRRVMIKRCRTPAYRRMAFQAVVGKIQCLMVWVRRRIKIRRVAAIAIRRQVLVLIVHMAACARGSLMRAREWIARRTMVERRRRPCRGGMARTTIVAEVSRRVIWICRLYKLRLVALVAIVERELVVVVRMTCLALRCRVCAGQREICQVMIERSPLPCRGCVALRAVMTVITGDMIRVVRVCKIIRMTLKACQRKILELIVHMTLRAC